MKIGILVNDIATEKPDYASTDLGQAAVRMGHDVWLISVGGFVDDPDERLAAWARRVPEADYDTPEAFLAAARSEEAGPERLTIADLDVLLLRNNPSEDMDRPWAQTEGILFGHRVVREGVLVLNDPTGLADVLNKMYLHYFPPEVRPDSLITRNREDIRRFLDRHDWRIVLKPLLGSGGESVFLVQPEDEANLNQMIDAIARDGYVMAQAYMPEAAEGDVRLFMMNGEPLVCGGECCAFRRVSKGGDLRSNTHAGGGLEKAEVTDEMLRTASLLRPKLVSDGLFLVGLDLAGGKLMEINAFSPGGLPVGHDLMGAPFSEEVIRAIERKVHYRHRYPERFDNRLLATV